MCGEDRCFHPAPFLCIAALISLVVWLFGSAAWYASQHPEVLTNVFLPPTAGHWLEWVTCVSGGQPCDLCKLPVQSLMFPPTKGGRAVAVSPHPYAGDVLRQYVEAATRVATGVERCFSGFSYGRSWDIKRAVFRGECASAVHWNHLSLVEFGDVQRADAMPGYEPNMFVFVLASPWATIGAAFDWWMACGGLDRDEAHPACLQKGPSPSAVDFRSNEWREFVGAQVAVWVDEVADVIDAFQRDNSTIHVVLLDELHGNPEQSTLEVLEFLRPRMDYWPSPEQAQSCISRAAIAPSLHERRPVSQDEAFADPDVRERVCDATKRALSRLPRVLPKESQRRIVETWSCL